ncbi:leucyl-tRNA synthetase [Babesia ovis]|uniref:leucine--tRNA ligase n=1 Tax=Babesia ovis TaxID=5869 RepID=A0A9W5WW36_BABOV|nr:leucyl-tRNA synthetase [Babesia ovis]
MDVPAIHGKRLKDSIGLTLLLLSVWLRPSVVCSWKVLPGRRRSVEIPQQRLFSAGCVSEAPQPRHRRKCDERRQRETTWQRIWESEGVFRADEVYPRTNDSIPGSVDSVSHQGCGHGAEVSHQGDVKPKFYGLCMIPYPSGDGLHVGHLLGYTALDVICRHKRLSCYRVLCPIGWDSFGLPAERYAQSINRDVKEVSLENIARFRSQLKRMGFGYDWSRELSTSDPKYYKWTQWMFQQFYKRGIAYRATQMVNWCPELNTVLANEEVKNGLSARGGYPVYRKGAEQWLLRISNYAQRLLEGLNKLEWPGAIVDAQRKWIGLEHGYKIMFKVADSRLNSAVNPDNDSLKLFGFVTDLDSLQNISHIELPVDVENLQHFVHPSAADQVEQLRLSSAKMSNLERYDAKMVVDTGNCVLNPISHELIPLVVTNTPMLFSQPINCRVVTKPAAVDMDSTIRDNVDSTRDTLDSSTKDNLDTIRDTTTDASVEPFVNVKMKDWIFSRARYWGEPIPLKLSDGEYVPIDPQLLPLETGPDRTETMPQWAGSSWHYLRFCDANNEDVPFDRQKADMWMPVDLYVGGTEHAVSHLLYARFWNKLLFDMGLSPVEEPFKSILLHGIIRSPSFSVNGQPIDPASVTKHKGRYVLKKDHQTEVQVKLEKMSKSKNNVVSPDDLIDTYGADALRLHLLFLGPIHKDKVWSDSGLVGVSRLLDRIETFFKSVSITDDAQDRTAINRLADRIRSAIEKYHFNVAVADFFKFFTHLSSSATSRLDRYIANTFLQLLSPFAPHIADELWHVVNPGFVGSIANTQYPQNM